MDHEVTSENMPDIIIEIIKSEDGMTGYVKLNKHTDSPEPITKEQLLDALHAEGITYGIKEASVEKMATRPIYNIKIEMARGLEPINGEDAEITYYVKKDAEYLPEFSEEGTIDYKNLDYFQVVKKDAVLAELKKETAGVDGMNIYGGVLPAKFGRPLPAPIGKNTHLIEDDTKLVADCDGVIRFVRDSIDVNEVFKINDSVGQHTGNIKFSGDVAIEGDVNDGYSVKAGGNIVIKGVVENAKIEAGGNVHISKGINGGAQNLVVVGGDLKCKYIEDANIQVDGNINADYIIDSKVTCLGNIELSGSKELIAGGEINILGELSAKDVGSENGRATKIVVIGTKIMDTDAINQESKNRDDMNQVLESLIEKVAQLNQSRLRGGDEVMNQLSLTKKQILVVRDKIDQINNRITELERDWKMEYYGAVLCKKKLYQGVRIHYGEEVFRFELDNLDHCRIFWDGSQIIQGTL